MDKVIKDYIIGGILVLVIGTILILVMQEGIKKHEIEECNNWAKMAGKYKDFYLTKVEAEQCSFLELPIDNVLIK